MIVQCSRRPLVAFEDAVVMGMFGLELCEFCGLPFCRECGSHTRAAAVIERDGDVWENGGYECECGWAVEAVHRG